MDVVSSSKRSEMMSGIKGRNTRPEIQIRRFLHSKGFRFRLHRKELPGSPDIVLPKYNACIFVHGCFWHRHENCRYTTTPATRSEFWRAKFAANVERDRRNLSSLLFSGWRVLIVWECGLRERADLCGIEHWLVERDRQFSQWP